MKVNTSLFNKLKLFKQFKKVIKDNQSELSQKFFLRIDRSYRLYTVLNIPEEMIGEAYALKKSDIDKISENFTREYTKDLSEFLNEKGLMELYEVYEIKKVDKLSYLIIIGFSLFKSNKYYNNLYYKILPASLLVATLLLIFTLL